MTNGPLWRVATYTGGNGNCVEVAAWRVATVVAVAVRPRSARAGSHGPA